jgi:hypothetical protein
VLNEHYGGRDHLQAGLRTGLRRHRVEATQVAAAEAAELPERSLIAAADALGVRTQLAQWFPPG